MNKLTLPIVVGKKYVRRDGEVITAAASADTRIVLARYVGAENEDMEDRGDWHAWADTGRIYGDPSNTSPRDLIADYVEGAASLPKPAEHPYASILRAIADGLEVQWEDSTGEWCAQNSSTTLDEISDERFTPYRYRIKPRTVTVAGIELPAPETVPPADGTICFFPNLATSGALSFVWAGTAIQLEALADGIVHLERDAAARWKEALLSITKGATQ